MTYASLGVERYNDAEECEQECEENQGGRLAPDSMGDRHLYIEKKRAGRKGGGGIGVDVCRSRERLSGTKYLKNMRSVEGGCR